MERTTFCLLFYIRRTKLNRNGEAPIMMRITVNGVRVDASVKKTILPEFWSVAKGKALEKKREYKELNLYLDSIRLRIMKIQRELEIIMDTPPIQLMQIRQYQLRVLCPKHDCLTPLKRHIHLPPIKRIIPNTIPLGQTIKEPLGIKGRNIR